MDIAKRFERFPILGVMLSVLSLTLAGCGGLPKITDTTTPWTNLGITREFSVDLDVPADKFTVTNLSVRFARHFWPGEAAANSRGISGAPPVGSFSTQPPAAPAFPNSHTVFYRWVATLQGTSPGATPFTIMTPLTRFVVGCTQADTDAQLSAIMATHSANFSTTTPHLAATRRQLGFPGRPHRQAVITGNGFTLSNSVLRTLADTLLPGGTGGLNDAPVLAEPTLLFYAPRQQAAGETFADYRADMADRRSDNDPYSFIGVAYATLYDPANRPLLGCVPSDAWFVHEAGYHMNDGDMILANAPDNQTGTGGSPFPALPPPRGAVIWHPRLWDLHVWTDPAGGPPILSIFEPNTDTTPNNPFDPPRLVNSVARGLRLPNGTFFRPTTFE